MFPTFSIMMEHFKATHNITPTTSPNRKNKTTSPSSQKQKEEPKTPSKVLTTSENKVFSVKRLSSTRTKVEKIAEKTTVPETVVDLTSSPEKSNPNSPKKFSLFSAFSLSPSIKCQLCLVKCLNRKAYLDHLMSTHMKVGVVKLNRIPMSEILGKKAENSDELLLRSTKRKQLNPQKMAS